MFWFLLPAGYFVSGRMLRIDFPRSSQCRVSTCFSRLLRPPSVFCTRGYLSCVLMCKIQGQKSSLVALYTGWGLLTGSLSEGQAGPFSREVREAGWGRACLWAGETPYRVASISAWRKKSWVTLAGQESKTLAIHTWFLFHSLAFNLVSTSPEFSHGALLSSVFSWGGKHGGEGNGEREFETLLPKQPVNQSACLVRRAWDCQFLSYLRVSK